MKHSRAILYKPKIKPRASKPTLYDKIISVCSLMIDLQRHMVESEARDFFLFS